mgnify:CR=1 FL=1
MRRGGVPPRCSWCGRTEYPPANQGRGQRAGTFVLLMRFSERQTDAPMRGGPIPKDSGGRRNPQILPRVGGVPEDRADDRASVDLAAVAAGRKPLFRYAFADPAQVAAIGEFHSLRAAARTMMVAAVICGASFISLHFRAVRSRRASSLSMVALRASQCSQSRPQQAINRFIISVCFRNAPPPSS